MRVLIADDDRTTTTLLSATLRRWSLEAIVARDGNEAWQVLSSDAPPSLAILDWQMPGVDGPDLCRRVRNDPARAHLYLILLTARDSRADIIEGIDAGADDYLVKPFDLGELRARINSGVRVISLQQTLSQRVTELEDALANVKRLHGLLPICSYCSRVRTDGNYWEQVDQYIAEHSSVHFSHGICPPCSDKIVSGELDPEDTTPVQGRSAFGRLKGRLQALMMRSKHPPR
ncbi:MAG: response regulator transcription factor [Acidimicrobiia bacterium]|nr:response regulator transcription factor [Acidimicrobiia bacterium]